MHAEGSDDDEKQEDRQEKKASKKEKSKKKKNKKEKKHDKKEEKHAKNKKHALGSGDECEQLRAQAARVAQLSPEQRQRYEEDAAMIRWAFCPDILKSLGLADQAHLKAFANLFEEAAAKNPEKGIFIEFYAGLGKVAARAEAKHDVLGIAIDKKTHPAWDLHAVGVVEYIRRQVFMGRVKGGSVATECISFTSARHGKEGDNCPRPLRDYGENAWGFSDLSEKDRAMLLRGNQDARITLTLIDAFVENQVVIAVENGDTSILWHLPEMKERLKKARIFKVDYCMMGRMFRKRTRLAVWGLKKKKCVADRAEKMCRKKYHCLSRKGVCCRTGKKHVILRGWIRGKALSAGGTVYPRKFANLIANLVLS